jgi:hypothetical protein
MTPEDYYKILGLPPNSALDEIKRAYRNKARLYHPDVNPTPEAEELFIKATEAYEFLINNHHRLKSDEESFDEAMEEWRKYRQTRAQRRAAAYARTSYKKFKDTKLYKTTKILDGTTIIFSFIISILVLVYTVIGYIYRLRNPIPGLEKPSVGGFILLLLVGIIFFVVSFIYLRAYQETSKKEKTGI